MEQKLNSKWIEIELTKINRLKVKLEKNENNKHRKKFFLNKTKIKIGKNWNKIKIKYLFDKKK